MEDAGETYKTDTGDRVNDVGGVEDRDNMDRLDQMDFVRGLDGYVDPIGNVPT